MTIELSPEEVRFLRQAIELTIEISSKLKAAGPVSAELAAKAEQVAESVLAKLSQPDPSRQ